MRKWLLAHWCSKRGVDNCEGNSYGAKFSKVGKCECRVRWSFGNDQHCSWCFCGLGKGARNSGVDKSDVDAHAPNRAVQECNGSAIQLLLSNNVVARGAEGKNHTGEGTHSRTKGQGVFGTL